MPNPKEPHPVHEAAQPRLRLDKWLWYARFCKSRSLATQMCEAGTIRLSGSLVSKAHQSVKPGDVLTFPQGRHIRVVRVLALGDHRGPASAAQALYEDLAPPSPETALPRGLAVPPAPLDASLAEPDALAC
ncbi:MAG TPA: RNA-binding S4 domain-containing protein [Alphaproteobacteria bacterium]|nr:RNA-binding S4 domain-containing protein [Alphaproteobacteria bacterium]